VLESAELRELKNRNRLLEQENEVLRRGVSVSRRQPKMMYPLVRELAVDGIPVAVTCRVLDFSKQGYFKWLANPVTDRDWADAHLIKSVSHNTLGLVAVNTRSTRSSWTGGPTLRDRPRFLANTEKISCAEHNRATRHHRASDR